MVSFTYEKIEKECTRGGTKMEFTQLVEARRSIRAYKEGTQITQEMVLDLIKNRTAGTILEKFTDSSLLCGINTRKSS